MAEYNKRLDHNREIDQTGEGEKTKVSGRLLKAEFNKVKPTWVNEVTCWAYQGAFDDLQTAFRNFWHKHKNGLLPKANKPRKDGRPNGWPRFKSRHKSTPAFYLANISLKFDGHNVQFDKGRVGWVNMTEPLRFDGKIMAGRISYDANQWWLSVQVEIDHEIPQHPGDAVGIDLGIKYLAVTSDGVIYDNPKPLNAALCKLRRLQRKLDRQRRINNPDNYNDNGTAKKGAKEWYISNKMKQTEKEVTKLHYRVTCLRKEAAHVMTTEIARDYAVIGVEDLNIKGMMKNGKLSKAVADAGLFEKRRQLTYKAAWNGGVVVPISTWFPSSKLCNNCGYINSELTLSTRQWTCPECGLVHHRDGNAALNIREEAVRLLNGNNRPVLPGSDAKAPALTQADRSNVAGESTH